jgi:hypothetical protein
MGQLLPGVRPMRHVMLLQGVRARALALRWLCAVALMTLAVALV